MSTAEKLVRNMEKQTDEEAPLNSTRYISLLIRIHSTAHVKKDTGVESHRLYDWKVQLTPLEGYEELLSSILERVVFELHPTFDTPLRSVSSPGPYVITEEGWGQFDMGVCLYLTHGEVYRTTHALRLTPHTPPPLTLSKHANSPVGSKRVKPTEPSAAPPMSSSPVESDTIEELFIPTRMVKEEVLLRLPPRQVFEEEQAQLDILEEYHKAIARDTQSLRQKIHESCQKMVTRGMKIEPAYE